MMVSESRCSLSASWVIHPSPRFFSPSFEADAISPHPGHGLAGIGERAHRLVALSHHEIGATSRSQPSTSSPFCFSRVASRSTMPGSWCRDRPRSCPWPRPPPPRAAPAGDAADPHQSGLHQRPPRRVGRRPRQHPLPDRGGIGLAAVLLGGQTEKVIGLGVIGAQRDGALELRLGLRGATPPAVPSAPRRDRHGDRPVA